MLSPGAQLDRALAPQARAQVYTHAINDDAVEVEVSAHTRFADYARRIAEAIEIIAAFKRREPTEILASLRRPESDIVRFSVDGQDTAMSTIALDDTIRLREARKKIPAGDRAHRDRAASPHRRLGRAVPLEFVASYREAVDE